MAALPMPISTSDRELEYRRKNYPDFKAIERKQIACATCGTNLSAKLEKPGSLFLHPFTNTLQCKKCSDFYGDGDFSMDEDGDDKYCRICGNGGELFICGKKPCPYGFCQKCIERYIGKNSSEVEADDWKCLHCNCKPLWEVRAVCAAIILEKPKKRSKHRTKSTRAVYKSDDDRNRSRDLDDDFERSKQVRHRPMRSMRDSKNGKEVLEALGKNCDDSTDSLDDSKPQHKPMADRKDSNARSRNIESGAKRRFETKKKGTGTCNGRKELSKKAISSEDETSDPGETQITRKNLNNTKIHNASAELESKSAKQRNNRSSSHSLKQLQRTENLSPTHLRISKSPESLKNPTSDSALESSNESANDFVKYKKKKKLKIRNEQSSKKNLTMQKQKSNDTENTNSKLDQKRLNTKLGKVVKSSKIRESSLESKRTKDKSTIDSVKKSSTNLITKKNVTSKMNTVESDENSDCSDERTIVTKESTLRTSKKHKRYNNSVNEENDEDKDPKTYAKASTSSTVDKTSGRVTKTKRLSTQPLCPILETSQTLSEFDRADGLDRKKASIKRSYAKILSTKDQNLTKDAEITMYDHLGNLINEIKLFSKSLCTGANVIGAKYLTNKTTSVQDLSKSVLKCALLMIRSKKSLNIIENEFTESYGKWCRRAKVRSIFSDEENSDVATGKQKVEPIIDEETSVDEGSEKDVIRQNSKKQKTTNNSAECSNVSNEDENYNVSDSVLETGNDSDNKRKSVETSRELGDPKSPIEIEKNIQNPVTRDSDAASENSIHDPMSDCDSKEIFSEDESRRQDNQAEESVTEQVLTQSPLKASKKRRNDDSESDDRETENCENKKEKSLHFDNVIEKSKDIAEKPRKDKKEKVTERPVKKNTEELLSVEQCIEDTDVPDLSLETIHNDTNLNLNEDSKHSDDSDYSVTKYLETTENLSLDEKSTVSEIKNGTIKDIQMADDDETIDFWDGLTSENNRTSSSKAKQDNEQKTLIEHSSSKANGSEEDLSDCGASIFTQLPSDTITKSNENDIAKGPVENLSEPENTSVSYLEVLSDTEIPSQNNNDSNDNLVSLAKEAFQSSELIAKEHKEDNKKSKDVSKGLKTRKKGQESENLIRDNSTTLVSKNERNDSKNSTAAIQENETGEFNKKEATTTDKDLEDAIKKKILESDDSELSDESAPISDRSNSFELKVNTDSEEYRNELIAADTTETIVTSEKTDVGRKSTDSKIKEEKSGISSASSRAKDIDVSELNTLAKHRLLSSSDTSISEGDDVSGTLPEIFDNLDSHSTSSRENSEIISSSIIEKESIVLSPCKAKRKKFNLEKNCYYKTDKKLQMNCEVIIRRLNETVLDQFTQLLGKSRERQELENFKSLVDLNNVKKRKRGRKGSNQSESSSESASSKGTIKKPRPKQVQEKEETLLDHLEKMKNGENYCNPSGDESDENNDTLKKIMPEETDQDEFLTEANKMAKDLLIQSSDSENEMKTSTGNAEEQEQDEEEPKLETEKETRKENQKKKSVQNEEALDSESNHENGSNTETDNKETTNVKENIDSKENEDTDSDRTRERKRMKDGLAKHNWRLTDSDSSDEEKKWKKSQQNKSDKKKTVKREEGSKNKKKVKRRVLGSDSDSVKLTDVSDDDDSNEENDKKKTSASGTEDSTELFNNLRKKRRRKRNAAQKSESDSDSDQDEKPAKQKRKRIKKMESDSDSDLLTNSQDTPGKLHRKNIRKVLKDKQVADVTKIAGKEEEERLKRIAERQKLYNEMYELKLANEARVDKLILDFDEETKKVLVSVHEDLVKRLKPHQAQGIKFMWDACFESLERTKSTAGSGCIVAHCMGLGKTFQVVTLAHTLLTHPETGIKTIMVICPLSTVLNWVNEFKKWLGDINNDEDVEVFEMTKMKKNFERKYQLEKWKRAGGVMVLGYEMFRLLSNQTGKKMRKSLHEAILKCLVDPGPDLIVCDEGHLLKNEDTALSKAMRRVKTLRRIVLTGTPLQNNLVEYHCMVQFVKPNLLGTKKEFLNRFVNPITNGQFDDSTEYDVKLMKKRAHVLHKMLEGSVQRFDYSVLTPFLPPKQEYVITVRLADIQIKLYQHYLDHFSRKKVGAGTSLFADFQALQRIWTHPIVLRMNAEKMERLNEKKRMDTSDSEGSLADFLDDGSEDKTTTTDDSDIQSAHSSSDEKIEKQEKSRRGTRSNPIDPATVKQEEEELPQSGEWWSQFVEPEHFEDLKISSKLVLLFAILKESEQIGDKVLVFSQSLYALSLIEEFLNKIDDETQKGTCSELIDGHSGSWSLGLDYFRLDGQTAPENRSHYCKIFNNPKNSRARLFLISTRAGGLGINLTAANRVIIFDASWNPSHDVQSIFRIYRFGQKKPCYVYRFLAQGTMEEKIYNRQVTKLSLSCRVVDEQQIERHYSNHDLAELYQFEPNTSKEKPTLNLPKDRLLAEIFRKYEDRIETFHEHDSLLENKAEEELDEEERKEAWKEYEDERTGRKVAFNNFPHQNFAMQQYNEMMNMNQADIANRATLSGINIETLQSLIRKDYPNSTPEQQTMMTQRAIMDMYTYMENEAIRQQQIAAAAANTFTYPTVSNLGTSGFIDNNTVTPAQRQYALQQQQMHQMIAQREQQANYAKRFGNVRGPGLSATATRPPQVVNLQDDNDIIEVPTTPPATAGPTPSSSVQAASVSTPAVAENSKRQEE